MAADSDELGNLHKAVAVALTDAIKPVTVTDDKGNDTVIPASAAHLSVAVAFLKANNITADLNKNKELAALADQLAARRRKKEIPALALVEAEEALAKSLRVG